MMNNKNFIKKLNKALSLLDKKEKENIIKEIQSHHEEEGQASLYQQFGDPVKLAKQYVDEKLIEKKSQKRKKKRNVIVLLIIVLIVALLYWGIKFSMKDNFDYANKSIRQQKLSDLTWVTIKPESEILQSKLNVNQSKLVIFSSKSDLFEISCKAKGESSFAMKKSEIIINKIFCYIRLPSRYMYLKSRQSSIALIEPNSIDIELDQSELRVSSGDNNYIYEFISLSQSYVSESIELANNHSLQLDNVYGHIKIQAIQSAIKQYNY